MMEKKIRLTFLLGLFLFSLVPLQFSSGRDAWWNDAWSYRCDIQLNHLTGNGSASYQPIDMTIRFDNFCWALNETHHSVRVICYYKNEPFVLESQLYDLVHCDETHISSCNLVFLLPPYADGTEQYFIYYDESATPPATYPDHVSLGVSSYHYEPIPGYPLESYFYQISQHDSIRYVVAKEGKFLWYTTSQYVMKLKQDSKEVAPKNSEAVASFEFVYYHGEEFSEYTSTSQQLVASEIICDGNLMVCFKIISRSLEGNLQTTAVYKYFYNPTSVDRIQAHVVHEALEQCQVYENTNTEGTYASLQCGGIRSASIPDLNFGRMYPFFHFYSEQDTIEEYPVDLFPESSQKDAVLWLLQTSDDVDIGKNAWVCFDEKTTGAFHAIVFGSSSLVKAGDDEQDGIQLKVYESNYPHLPGLDNVMAVVECGRNVFEKETMVKDTVIPKGFIAEFDAEFFSSSEGGVSLVEKEAGTFQALVPMKPSVSTDSSSMDDSDQDHYSLTVFVYNAVSFPFGSVFSAVTGRRFPYITLEVYQDTKKLCSGTANRLPLQSTGSSEGLSLKDTILNTIRMVDFRNLTFFKKFSFEHLSPGRYMIKVFKENPWLGTQRRFIGWRIVDLSSDSTVRIVCQPQGSCIVSLVDQHDRPVSDAEVMLVQQGLVVSSNWTNADGVTRLTAPCDRKHSYQLVVRFQGFEVANESVRLRFSRVVIPLKKTVHLDRYDWAVTLIDLWGLPPEIDIVPRLTSTSMRTPTVLFPEQSSTNYHQFKNLVPATFLLQIHHKSFTVEKEINIPSSDQLIEFPAAYPVSFHVYDSRGSLLHDVIIQLSRKEKTQEIQEDEVVVPVSLPPGTYEVKILLQGTVIGKRFVRVMSERSVDLVTNQEPLFPSITIACAVAVACIGIAHGLIMKKALFALFGCLICLLVVSLVLPWWLLHGVSSDIDFSSTLFLLPTNLVTWATTSKVIAGELTVLPDLFVSVMLLIQFITGVIIFLCVFLWVLQWRRKHRYAVVITGLALILCLCVVGLFIAAMTAFTEISVGSVSGQGTLDVFIPGDEAVVSLLCQWGPGTGFWLQVVCVFSLFCFLVIHLKKKMKKE